jgi:hypothetical protein
MSSFRRSVAVLVFASAAATLSRAQSTFVFDLNQSASNFTWTGTSTFGNIVGNPSNQFQLAGTANVDLVLVAGAHPFTSGAFTGGSMATVPDIHGRINNPIPFLPPLATVDVTGLVITPSSPSFAVDLAGAFTASVTVTALAGTLTVTPLGQSPSSTPLAGNSSTPTSVSGTLTFPSQSFHLNAPISTTFTFSDPTSGASGSVTLVGTIVSDFRLARGFCFGDGSGLACPCGNNSPAGGGAGCLNSLGTGARLAAAGIPALAADSLVITGTNMPATASALYFQGTTQAGGGAGTAFGDGLRCAGGAVIRLGTKTNAGGTSSYPAAGDASISIRGAVPAPATTRTYQAWYRNAAAFCTVDTFNLTNGLSVEWIP